MAHPSWLDNGIKGLLIDIYGVLLNCTDGGALAIEGSLDAVKRLKAASYPVRFCSNESQMAHTRVVEKLQQFGFPVEAHEVFTPVPAMKNILKERNLRPYMIVHEDAKEAFNEVDQTNPNCVVLGDAGKGFTYEAMNDAFKVLLQTPVLFSMGYGKFYQQDDRLVMDVGCYSKALEYACNIEATIVGKPSSAYFLAALKDMGLEPSQAIMIGDDIVSDVGGAQKCGVRGIQVRTGKYRSSDEPHDTVVPAGYVNNLAEAVDSIIKFNK